MRLHSTKPAGTPNAMMTTGKPVPDLYARASIRIRRSFEASWDGMAAVRDRSALVDTVVARLWADATGSITSGPQGAALVARGGYGRATLFPHSDVDLLFLFDNETTQRKFRNIVGRICQQLWDSRIRVGPTARTLSECTRFDPNNLEFIASLIDCRYVVGDQQLFVRLHDETLPQLIHREWQGAVRQLLELTQARHAKYGNTIFHLEPNIKESPGGLRDFNVGCCLRSLAAFERCPEWPSREDASAQDQCSDAVSFLTAVRCFLHYHHGRDDNVLSWQDQDLAADRRVCAQQGPATDAAHWMRFYFRAARQIARWTGQLLDEVPAARSSVYGQFLRWRSRLSNADFSVVKGRVYLQQSSAAVDPDVVLRLFDFVALHGLPLARDTEARIQQGLETLRLRLPHGAALWPHLRSILHAPHAAQALREMNAVGLLGLLLPEFSLIDSLVVRDYYHRYTVDEHTLIAVETLHRLRHEDDARYAHLLQEVEEPELLYLALLLHDVGKGNRATSHVETGAQLAEQCLARLALPAVARETVRFLVANHLDMSTTLRRDVFDSETICAFADKVRSPELLRMLCLLTYADIRAVNPEALTPWKADNLWHLYVGTLNHLNRTVDASPLSPGADDALVRAIGSLAPRHTTQVKAFLDGLPRRYACTHPAEDIAAHFQMASRLRHDPVQLTLKFRRDLFELTLITAERPGLFACIAGALTSWGVDIVKAAAFSNASGVVVDTLVFRDRFRNLELNPPERERFQRTVRQALTGEIDLEQQIQSRIHTGKFSPIKRVVESRVRFDNECSSHSTVIEIVAQDRPGLLYQIASAFARFECNIEIALVETEGPMAIDVFYVTHLQGKLGETTQEAIQNGLGLLNDCS